MNPFLSGEKQAAIDFVNFIQMQPAAFRQSVHIGVVSWSGNNNRIAATTKPLTSDLNAVKTYINSITYQNTADLYTCIECAVNQAASLLTASPNRKVVILMSDGVANRVAANCTGTTESTCRNPNDCTNTTPAGPHCVSADTAAIAAAATQKSTGIIFHVVGYGSVSNQTILENNLRAIASGDSNYHYGGDVSNWSAVFQSIVPQICGPGGTPTPTPTPPPLAGCNGACLVSANCSNGLTCSWFQCRNSACPNATHCI